METSKWQSGRGREILEQASDFFYFDDSLSERIDVWCTSRCETFQGPAGRQEQSLLNTQIFQQFCELFEEMLEGFLSESGIQVGDFYNAVRNELDMARCRESTFSNIVLSTVDYFNFCEMMNDVREGRGFAFVPPLISIDELTHQTGSHNQNPNFGEDFGAAHQYGHDGSSGGCHRAEGKYADDSGDDMHVGASSKGDKDEAPYGGESMSMHQGECKFHK